jgi:asparagine synthase (glutamine-hydrolysing)
LAVDETLERMLQRLQRGSSSAYESSTLASLRASVGWVTEPGHAVAPQFAWSADRQTALLFLGEEFSVAQDPAYRAAGAGTAAALLACHQRQGAGFVAQLNGQFCGVLFDLNAGTAMLFNDRFGLGRVYYHEAAGAFHFATEAKALLAVAPDSRQLDARSMAEYVALGCVLQDRTLFAGIQLLPPGSAWVFHADGRVVRRRYFDPATWEQQPALEAAEYREQLNATFARATRRCLHGSGLGMSLTGGLDSRAVLAWAGASAGSLPCYTFAGPYRDCADARIARRLAKASGQPHSTIRIGNDFFSEFDTLAQRAVQISDGTMDVTGAVELYANRQARDIAGVRLTGNYGSEIIRSHVALRPTHLDRQAYTPEFSILLDEALDTYRRERQCATLSFIAFKQMPWHHYARRSLEMAELSPRSPFLDNDVVAAAYRAPVALRTSVTPMLELIAAGDPALARIETDRALRLGGSPLLTRMSSGWQNFTVKAEYAYDYGMPQWLARADRMLSRLHLERLFLGRHKFYHFRVWYRDQLRDYLGDRIGRPSDPPFGYRTNPLDTIVRAHVAGRANHTLALHRALTLQLIDQLFLHSA